MKMMLVRMGELYLTILLLACFHNFALSDYQGDALFSLRRALNATENQLTDWNPNQVNPCTWTSVICNGNNVISVSLSAMGFTGTLSPKIGVLKSLSTLILQGNHITGEIPKDFGNLTNLVSLDLGNNSLTGHIPSSLGNLQKLQFLTLSHNRLTGTIPESLSSIPSLISLLLDSNDLTGPIPEQLFQASKFKYVELLNTI
ncbi:putative LRR receptor-like serine/threonine-protein kinase [Cucurbita argyrosperma subsp. argyrosperma]|nr:putative LRR receptor-like serine/threonine-protein kinase [Cucurbita argyrosperma subsp. argyrosperma]